MDKKHCAPKFGVKKAAMTPAQIQGCSRELTRMALASPLYEAARSIYGYLPYNQEVHTLELLQAALNSGKRVAVPKVFGDTMRFIWLTNLQDVAPGYCGIPEPLADGPEADDPHALVLMPGLAFDPAGHRVGYGGGFYDKFLAQEPEHPTLALCYGFSTLPLPGDRSPRRPCGSGPVGPGAGGIGMKYVWLVLFLAAVFGLCFLADRCIGKVQARAQRRPAVRLPLRYPLLSVLLLLVAPVSAWYGITHAAPLFVAGAVLLAGISLYGAWTYHRTGIDYTSDCFTFRAGDQKRTFRFSQIQGRGWPSPAGPSAWFCARRKEMWSSTTTCRAFQLSWKPLTPIGAVKGGLDPQAQDWHNPADHRWFPDQPDETH